MASLERTVVCLVQASDPKAAMTTALSYLMEAAGADMGAVFDPAGTSLRLSFGHGLPSSFLRKPPLLARADWEGAMIVKHPTGPVTTEPVTESSLEHHARLSGMITWASLPIAYRDDFFGLLLVASRDLVGFSDQAVEIFSIVSRVLGLVLHASNR
jgi:GAF domain-containing protein